MSEVTITAPAAPAAAPVAAPAPAPVAAPAPAPTTAAVSSVDPGKFPIREDYAAALLTEKLAAIEPTPEIAPVVVEETVTVADVAAPR